MLAREGEPILSVGPAPHLRELTAPVRQVHVPLGSAALCGRRMAKLAGEAELIHAWSPVAFRAARAAGRLAGLPVVYSLPCLPVAASLERALELTSAALAILTVPTNAARNTLVRRGAPASGVHVLPPPGQPPTDRDRLRRRVRETLDIADCDFLLVAPGEITRDAGHMYACWAFAIVRHIRGGAKLLIPAGGPAFRSAKFFSGKTGFEEEVFFTEGIFSLAESLAAADAAVFCHKRDCGVAALAAAMAAGLPIVASQTPDAADCTRSGEAALLTPAAQPQFAAAEMLKLIEEPASTGRLARAAGAVAAERFAPDECRGRLDSIYSAAASACPA